MKEDLKLPEENEPELCAKIKEEFNNDKDLLLTVLSAMGQEKVISHREASKWTLSIFYY